MRIENVSKGELPTRKSYINFRGKRSVNYSYLNYAEIVDQFADNIEDQCEAHSEQDDKKHDQDYE